MKFEFTCYYPFLLNEQKKESVFHLGKYKGPYGSFSNTLKVSIDGQKKKFFVYPKAQYEAAVEGSATLTGLDGHEYGLAFHSNKWHFMNHSFGVGSFGNKLVPYRDCANNHFGFATALVLKPAPSFLTGMVEENQVFFVADMFGPSALGAKRKDRIDLFVAKKTMKRGFVDNVDVFETQRPIVGGKRISRRTVKGAQECLNHLGFTDSEGNDLKVDDDFGKKTKYACTWFVWHVFNDNAVAKFKPIFGCEIEAFEIEPNPRDPAFYFLVRYYATR